MKIFAKIFVELPYARKPYKKTTWHKHYQFSSENFSLFDIIKLYKSQIF